jgi:hypothetical protein
MQLAKTIGHWCVRLALISVIAGLVYGGAGNPEADARPDAQAAELSIVCIPGSTPPRPLGAQAAVFSSGPAPQFIGSSGTGSLQPFDCTAGTPFVPWQPLS